MTKNQNVLQNKERVKHIRRRREGFSKSFQNTKQKNKNKKFANEYNLTQLSLLVSIVNSVNESNR